MIKRRRNQPSGQNQVIDAKCVIHRRSVLAYLPQLLSFPPPPLAAKDEIINISNNVCSNKMQTMKEEGLIGI
jgi:hypothetical protein